MQQPEQKQICANCGAASLPGAQFCAQCGHNLTSPNSMPTVSSSNVPPTVRTSSPSLPAASFAERRMTGALQAQDMLQQRYHIQRLVGRGGFGAVYEAADSRLGGRRVAIKEMSYAQFDATERKQAVQDFEHEATLLANLDHPNLPKVIDFFEEDGKAYIVMEFVAGKTLQKVQEELNSTVDESRAMRWTVQLCEVLSYLHTQPEPIIFRDLKPSNIMVTKNDEIKLIDFGIARIFKPTATGDTRLVLSRNFAPPEQFGIGSTQTDARSDIYALGATLYILLTNQLPADALNRLGNANALTRPNYFNPQITPATEAILSRALAMNPNQRFQSTAEMAETIKASRNSVPFTPARTLMQPTSETMIGTNTDHNTGNYTGSPGGGGGNIPPHSGKGPSRRRVIQLAIAGGLVAAAGAAAFAVYEQTIAASINIDFAYSTEKDAWLTPLITDFNQRNIKVNNKPVVIKGAENGSVATLQQIISGQYRPTVWSPASSLELSQLRAAFKDGQLIANNGPYVPVSLVSSPLIFAIWSERVDVLLHHYQNTISWASIHAALQQKNWSAISGKPEWGVVKFAHTNPTLSNSGLLAITLIAYQSAGKQEALTMSDVNIPTFQPYLKDFDHAVFIGFGSSSQPYIQNVVDQGPTQADIICTYENLVLDQTLQRTAQSRWGQSLQIFYPDLNILSDHPFAILQGSWVSEDQKAAALAFQQFLLDHDQQVKAVQLGFRPSSKSSNVYINDANTNQNSFAHLKELSPNQPLTATIQPIAQTPTGDVINALLTTWKATYPNQ